MADTPRPKPIRDSNGELLRLLCMLMIVMHHWVVHAMYPGTLELQVEGLPYDNHVVLLFHCFFYIGVNCFVLLSGYYSIRLKPRSLLKLWFICFFYALVRWVEKAVMHGWGFASSTDLIYTVVMPFTHTDRWFIVCYVALMLLSPLLNAALDTVDRRQHRLVLLLSSALMLWGGYAWKVEQMGGSGYTTLQFIWLYIIGGYLHRYWDTDSFRRHRWHYWWVYVACSLLWGVLSMLKAYQTQLGFRIPLWHPFCYNNPLVMGASVGFFLFVMSFRFQNKAINWMAASALAVYLVQEGVFRYHWLAEWSEAWSPAFRLLALFPMSVAFMLSVILFDQVRIGLWNVLSRGVSAMIDHKKKKPPLH